MHSFLLHNIQSPRTVITLAKQRHPTTSDALLTFLFQILSVNPTLALLRVILLNLFPEFPVDKSISAGIISCPGRDSMPAERATKTGLFNSQLETRITEGMVAWQRDGLHKDLHANLAEAVRQGKRSLRFLRHADSK